MDGQIQDGARGALLGGFKMARGGSSWADSRWPAGGGRSAVGVGWSSPFGLRCVDPVFLKVDILPFLDISVGEIFHCWWQLALSLLFL